MICLMNFLITISAFVILFFIIRIWLEDATADTYDVIKKYVRKNVNINNMEEYNKLFKIENICYDLKRNIEKKNRTLIYIPKEDFCTEVERDLKERIEEELGLCNLDDLYRDLAKRIYKDLLWLK